MSPFPAQYFQRNSQMDWRLPSFLVDPILIEEQNDAIDRHVTIGHGNSVKICLYP